MVIEGLTDRERQTLDHLQKAHELGVSLKEYAEAYALDVRELYNGKAQLARKGALPGKSERTVEFLPVEVAPAPVAVACRIAHPSGWTIECANLPDAAWLQMLLRPVSS